MSDQQGDVSKFKQLETAAEHGPSSAQQLSTFVQDLFKHNPGALTEIGKQVQREGQHVEFDKGGGFLSIDDGHVGVFRQRDGDVATVRRSDDGKQVQEITYTSGTTQRYKYGADGTIDSMTLLRPGKPDQELSATLDRQILVDHDGNMTLKGFLGNQVEYRIDGEVRITDTKGIKTVANSHGEFASPDSVDYGHGQRRALTYSDSGNDIMSFTDPDGVTFTRQTNYRVGDENYYAWKGSDGRSWNGSLTFQHDKTQTVSPVLQIRVAGSDGVLGPERLLNVQTDASNIAPR